MDLTTLFKMSYGVYVVGSMHEGKYSACIATTAMQVTSEGTPKLVAVINKQNYTHELIQKSKKVNISVLSQKADLPFIGNFGFQSGRDSDKLANITYENGINNIPVITQNAVVSYETSVIDEVDVGTHTIFILLLENTKKISDDDVLTYDYYHKVIKGKVPKTAATFLEDTQNSESTTSATSDKYQCIACGYIYDDEKEDVKFEDLPDDWVCPICKSPKSAFKKIN